MHQILALVDQRPVGPGGRGANWTALANNKTSRADILSIAGVRVCRRETALLIAAVRPAYALWSTGKLVARCKDSKSRFSSSARIGLDK